MKSHDVDEILKSKKVKHAILRFHQRYGKRLSREEYWSMNTAINSCKGELIFENSTGFYYQLEWNGNVYYPLVSRRSRRIKIIVTFLEPYMALHKIVYPYWGRSRVGGSYAQKNKKEC